MPGAMKIVCPDRRFAAADCSWLTVETLMTVPVGAGSGGTVRLFGNAWVVVGADTDAVVVTLLLPPSFSVTVSGTG